MFPECYSTVRVNWIGENNLYKEGTNIPEAAAKQCMYLKQIKHTRTDQGDGDLVGPRKS